MVYFQEKMLDRSMGTCRETIVELIDFLRESEIYKESICSKIYNI